MKTIGIRILFYAFILLAGTDCIGQARQAPEVKKISLKDASMRDGNMLANPLDKMYYIVVSAGRSVRAYKSQDLKEWEGPYVIFNTPDDIWPYNITGIWAPEMHFYKGRFYLFLTFNSPEQFPEQWPDWPPRVRRGSHVLVSDSPLGPFRPFKNGTMLPAEMMTLDGTLYVEDGIPYMVYCHEWVQIVNGTVEMIQLKEDLSATEGKPVRLFYGSQAPWTAKKNVSWVTDGPSFHKSRSGKLFMIWSGFGDNGYTTGIAISESGKLAGPWRQQQEPLYSNDGGHGFIFKRFDGQLMLVLHQPNSRSEHFRLFELEDTGETLRITAEW